MSVFDTFSPTDYRYSIADLKPYLSEEAFITYKARVESALVRALADRGLCSQENVVGFFQKPFDVAELGEKVELILNDESE